MSTEWHYGLIFTVGVIEKVEDIIFSVRARLYRIYISKLTAQLMEARNFQSKTIFFF